MKYKQFIFEMSCNTPYLEKEIVEFMYITNLPKESTRFILNSFSEQGISRLLDINILIKLGYFDKNKDKPDGLLSISGDDLVEIFNSNAKNHSAKCDLETMDRNSFFIASQEILKLL